MTDSIPTDDVAPEQGTPATSSSPRPVWLIPTITAVGGFVLGMLVFGGGLAVSSGIVAASHDAAVQKAAHALVSTFPKALKACHLANNADSQIADGGYTLTINNQGTDDASGISFENLACLETRLKTPASVVSHLEQTTSLDGRQTESWGKLTMSWTYHPSRGLDAVYTLKH